MAESQQIMGKEFCQPCFERAHVRVKSTHNVSGTRMCDECFGGKTPVPPKTPIVQEQASLAAPIKSAGEMAEFISTLMGDIRSGKVTPEQAHAICKSATTFLQIVQLQMKLKTNKEFFE